MKVFMLLALTFTAVYAAPLYKYGKSLKKLTADFNQVEKYKDLCPHKLEKYKGQLGNQIGEIRRMCKRMFKKRTRPTLTTAQGSHKSLTSLAINPTRSKSISISAQGTGISIFSTSPQIKATRPAVIVRNTVSSLTATPILAHIAESSIMHSQLAISGSKTAILSSASPSIVIRSSTTTKIGIVVSCSSTSPNAVKSTLERVTGKLTATTLTDGSTPTALAEKSTTALLGKKPTTTSLGSKSTAATLGGRSTTTPLAKKSPAERLGDKFPAALLDGKSTTTPLDAKFPTTAALLNDESTETTLGGESTAALLGGKSTKRPLGEAFTTTPLGETSTTLPRWGGKSPAALLVGKSTTTPLGGKSTTKTMGGKSTTKSMGGKSTAALLSERFDSKAVGYKSATTNIKPTTTNGVSNASILHRGSGVTSQTVSSTISTSVENESTAG